MEAKVPDPAKTTLPRTRRRNNGRAYRAGIADPPTRDSFSRTLALVRAALRVWEARNPHPQRAPVWRTVK